MRRGDSLRRPAADVEPAAGRRVRCLMASESFGCHGITRSRQGGFLERDCRCSFCRQRAWSFGWCLAVLHEARGLLGKVWVYSMWRAGARVVLTTLGQYIPTPVEWADPKGLGSEPVLSQCHWDLAQGADEAGGGVRTCREDPGPGYASGPVSTQRTSVSPPSMSPARILEILRFWLGLWEPVRC